jgi:hypothetical protein
MGLCVLLIQAASMKIAPSCVTVLILTIRKKKKKKTTKLSSSEAE